MTKNSNQFDAGKAERRLKELSGQAGPNLYERVQLAAKLLGNNQWLEAKFQGDEAKAGEHLQKEYFQDIGGLLSIWRLRDVYILFSDEEKWRENKYNLKVLYGLWQEWRERQDAAGRSVRTSTRKIPNADLIAEKEEQVKEKEYVIKQQKLAIESKEELVNSLTKALTEARLEIAELRGRIKELERARGFAEVA